MHFIREEPSDPLRVRPLRSSSFLSYSGQPRELQGQEDLKGLHHLPGHCILWIFMVWLEEIVLKNWMLAFTYMSLLAIPFHLLKRGILEGM
jgi:hypothetical protein